MTANHTIFTAGASRVGEITIPKQMPGREPMLGFRIGLRMAFRRLGVSIGETQAYNRTKDFYRRGGGAWTNALR